MLEQQHAGPTEDAEHLRLVLETANDAFIGIDESGRVIDWNRQAERLFGWGSDEAQGCLLADLIIPEAHHDAHHEGLRRFVETGQGRVVFQRLELPAHDREGRRLDVELTIWPSRVGGRWRFNAFLRDVTASRREQRAFDLLADVTRAANEALDPEPAVRVALQRVCEVTGWPLGHAWLVEGGEVLRPTGWWHRSAGGFDAFVEATRHTTFVRGSGLPGRVLASGRPSWIVDVLHDADFPRLPHAAGTGLHSAVAFPVLVGDTVVAVLEFLTTDVYASDPGLEQAMSNVGVQLGRVFERRDALEREREAAEFRKRMLSVLSHDLRTPTVAMAGFAKILATEEVGAAEVADLTGRIHRQGERVLRLVNELLTVQRLDAGAVETDPADVDLVGVVHDVVADLDMVDDVVVEGPPSVLARVDPSHLDRVLTNLLANARRHGRPPVHVTLRCLDGRVEMVVGDSGDGLDPEIADHVFEPFATGDRHTGTGLGLSIVQGLLRHNAGTIRHEPADEGGARFVVVLPVGGDAPEPA